MGFGEIGEKLFGRIFNKPKIQNTTPEQPLSSAELTQQIDQLSKAETSTVQAGTPMDITGADAIAKAASLEQLGRQKQEFQEELNDKTTNTEVNATIARPPENPNPVGVANAPTTTEKPQ